MLIIQLTGEELQEKIRSAVRAEIQNIQPAQNERLLTRTQAAKLLDISLPTLSAWAKSGQVKPVRLGSRVYFKESDLMNV